MSKPTAPYTVRQYVKAHIIQNLPIFWTTATDLAADAYTCPNTLYGALRELEAENRVFVYRAGRGKSSRLRVERNNGPLP